MIEVNLLPGQKRNAPKGGGGGLKLPDFRALLTNIKDPWLLSAIGAWVLAGAVGGGLFILDTANMARLNSHRDDVRKEMRRWDGLIAQKHAAERARDSLVAELNVIRQIDAQRYVWPHIMDQVTKALPPYTWVAKITQLATAAPAPGAGATSAGAAGGVDSTASQVLVNLNGLTVDIQAYTTFLRQLAASPWFTDVTPASSQTVIDHDRPVTAFSVSFRFKVADSLYIRTVPLVQSVR
jgi:Tfp pilus assembly protein PilN